MLAAACDRLVRANSDQLLPHELVSLRLVFVGKKSCTTVFFVCLHLATLLVA